MKYIVRLLAAIPAIGAGISFILAVAFSFDYTACVFLAVANLLAWMVTLSNYERTVKDLKNLFYILSKK